MRKKRAVKRDVLPDPIYNSKIVTKLINQIMIDGKRGIAQNISYEQYPPSIRSKIKKSRWI